MATITAACTALRKPMTPSVRTVGREKRSISVSRWRSARNTGWWTLWARQPLAPFVPYGAAVGSSRRGSRAARRVGFHPGDRFASWASVPRVQAFKSWHRRWAQGAYRAVSGARDDAPKPPAGHWPEGTGRAGSMSRSSVLRQSLLGAPGSSPAPEATLERGAPRAHPGALAVYV